MISDREVEAKARTLIAEHGDRALIIAQRLVNMFVSANDPDATDLWRSIVAAIEVMQAAKDLERKP
jgi:hypothetical protein